MIIHFDRIGRNHNPPDLKIDDTTIEDADLGAVEEAVYRHARPHLASRGVEVAVDLEAGTVRIFAGLRNAGLGHIEESQP
jgi:hypothetical protein